MQSVTSWPMMRAGRTLVGWLVFLELLPFDLLIIRGGAHHVCCNGLLMVKKFIRANLQKNTGVLTATAAQPSVGSRSARSSRPKRHTLDRGRLYRDRWQAFGIF